jgi:putative hydrolase of the HAD superfamily
VRIRAVTLDAAGTLFDVAEPVGVTYARVAARHGVALAAGDVDRRFRAAMATAPPMAFGGTDPADLATQERGWWQAVVATALGPAAAEVAPACFGELFEHYARAEAWRVYADVPSALAALRARGVRIAVVSNFDGRLPGLLAGLGLAPLLDHALHSTRAGCAKPAPAIFRAALAAIGVTPAEALHAGDGVTADVDGARVAGLRPVLVDRVGRRPPLPPTVVAIRALDELPALVAQAL